MTKKTYIVKGYIEWIANINVGSASIQIPFSGGAVTKYGTVPAEYTTSDLVIQKIIEGSAHFLNNRITLHKAVEIPDPQDSPGPQEPDQPQEPEPTEGMETIPVHCLTDAADILYDRFRISAAKVPSKKDARRIGREHNIEFIFVGL